MLDTDKISSYLKNGARPSERVAKLLEKEGVKLPGWVKPATKKKRSIKNPDKLRRNRPEETPATAAEAPEAEPGEQTPDTEETSVEDQSAADNPEPAAPDEQTEPEASKSAAEPETEAKS